jgi:hypothetical protein
LGEGGVDDGVVDTGETEDGDTVAGGDDWAGVTGPDRLVVQRGGYGADALAQLAVGDDVDVGQQFGGGTARRVGDELHGPRGERGPVGVARQDGAHELRQPQVRIGDGMVDGWVRLGGRELLVAFVKLGDAALEPVFAGI